MRLTKIEKITAAVMMVSAVITVAVILITFHYVEESERVPFYYCIIFMSAATAVIIVDLFRLHRMEKLRDSKMGVRSIAAAKTRKKFVSMKKMRKLCRK